jgi:uncharacterized protein (DUF1015 family)
VVDAAPFRAVRYDPRVSGDPGSTSAPAYDDVEPLAYARHRTASPYTVLELLAGGAAADAGGYAGAGASLERWRRTGVLVTEPDPAFYLYEEHALHGGVPTLQRGVLAAVAVTPLDAGGDVLPHEAIDAERVGDRLARLSAVPIDVSPVFGIYRGSDDALTALLSRRPRIPPIVAITDEDGTDHRIWALRDPAEMAVIRAGLQRTRVVIADGHHRYATAAAFAERMGGPISGELPPWRRTLMYLVDTTLHGPRVEPIHRLVETMPPEAGQRLDGLVAREPVVPDPARIAQLVAARADGTVGLLTHDGQGALLRIRDRAALAARLPAGRSATWRALDAALLDHGLLPAIGVSKATPRSDPVTAGLDVRRTPGSALLLLAPVPASTVIALAEAGEPMPAKTTSFHPKPRTGLLLRDVLPARASPRAGATARPRDGDRPPTLGRDGGAGH